MPKAYRETESDIQDAVNAIQRGDFAKVAPAARHFNVPYNRLRARLAGRKSRSDRTKTNQRLTADQDAGLCQYLDRLDQLGLSARPKHIEAAANLVLRSADQNTSEYKKKRQRLLQLDRQLAHDPKNIEAWFLSLCQLLHEFGVSEGDMYNYDESGFMVGYGRSQWIVTKAPDRQSYLASSQNRETVTVGETVSGDDNNVLIAVSDSGYTNDEISLAWFKHFDKFSAKRQTGAWRLLLLDSHGSHATKDFLDYGDDHKILLYYLPPHATHFLQPLDVVVFQPYKHWHAEAVDAATRTGCTGFNKVEFLAALQPIRSQTLQKSTVLSAWRQTGLIPWNPNLVIDRIQAYAATQPRTPSPPQETPSQTVVETPSTTRALRTLAMQLVDDNQLDLNNATIRRFLKGSLKQAEAGNLALDYLSRTQAAEKAREQRRKGSRRVTQKGGLLYAGQARSVKINRAQKEEAIAMRRVEKEQQQDDDIEDEIVVYMR